MWNPLKKEAVMQNLKDAGCDQDFVTHFLRLVEEGTQREQLHALAVQRERLLTSLRSEQKRIDCLDYLIYQMKGHAK